ncbi:hypothetical protein GOP47_0012981 [Adiantum capillus-veneris]|uniref:Pentatricopeptide repeat-containing protein n=1 Tax=Adiantum capillus-veneris TaxID=13818 RepID=A0A9D4US38_ADICA|nr:hypothetical protein GOP47_0012981 [Adiantum capillus-veneris]
MAQLLCENPCLMQPILLEQFGDLPSLEKYTSILHRCRKDRNLAFANHLHTHLCGNGLEAHKTIGNHLVPMFVECGSAINAQQVFNRLTYLNEFSWTSLIEGYIDSGNVQHALSLYERMKENHVSPSKFTFMALIKACSKLKCLAKGREMHIAIVQEEYESDHFIGSSLIGMYAKCGSIIEARDVFEELSVQDVVSWTALITGYVDQGLAANALECSEKMLQQGLIPDRVTFINILKACGMSKDLRRGRNVHDEIRKQGFRRDPSITSALLDMYVGCGAFTLAKEVLHDVSSQDVAMWNILMAGYVDRGLNEEALDLYKRMQKERVSPDATTIVCSLRACASSQNVDMGLELHKQIDSQKFSRDPFVGSTLVDMYSKFGLFEKAKETFDSLSVKEVVSWTALISGYSEHGFHEQAISCFKMMQEEGMEPDAVTFMCCLRSVGNLGVADIGQELHARIIEEGYNEDQRLGSSLVTMYVKCGLIAEAQDVFTEVEDPDLVSWTALISGYADLGHGEAALDLLEQMQAKGLRPDAVTLVSSLKACCSIASLSHGQAIHRDIVKEGFEGVSFVANSLMDLYVKCGHVLEASDVFDELSSQDMVSWTVLISGYVDNGFPEKALIYYKDMKSKGVSPNSATLASTVRACGSLEDLDHGLEIHYEVILNGFETDPLVCSTLVGMYARTGLLEEAENIYSEFPSEDPSIFNALVVGYIEEGLDEKAFAFVKHKAVELNSTTFITCLKACGSVKSLADGHAFHIEIMKRGLDRDLFIGNALVDFYMKCNSILNAQKVFDMLPVRDVVLWNTMAAGYAESNLEAETLRCLNSMQKEGILANASTYACILGLCMNLGSIQTGQALHQEMVMKGVENEQVAASALLGMYAKLGLLSEARELFDRLTASEPVCWNALIAGYGEHGLLKELLDCLKKMDGPANAAIYISSLKACKATGSLGSGHEVHALITQEGYEDDALIGSSLVDMYMSCSSMQDAEEVFEDLPVHDAFAWTALITGYIEQGFDQKALNCYEQMQRDGIAPDVVTMVCSLQACGNLRAVDKVQATHLELTKKGFEKQSSVGNHLVQTYAKCSSISEAQEVFEGLSSQSIVSWTALITAYSGKGIYFEVLDMLEKMESGGVSADAVTFVCSLRALGTIGDVCTGRTVHMLISKKGFDGDPHIGNTLVGMYAKCNSLAESQYVFDRLSVQDVVSWTALMGGVSEQGAAEQALECFYMMQSQGVLPDAVSWNAVISGFVERGQSDQAHLYFRQMQEQGLLPSSMIYLTMMKAYGTTASLDAGRKCHAQTNSIRQESNESMLTTALIDMYGKCGDMSEAQKLFDASTIGDVDTWNALVAGYTGQGHDELSLCSLQKMLKSIPPNEVTFVTAITACSHVGLVELGQYYFQCMNREYGIEPTMKHYNCLLDLLGRAGQVDEALLTLSIIPFEVDFVVWSTVMGACKKYGDLLLGRRAFSHAMRLEEDHNALFILMSNLSVNALLFDEDDGIMSKT